MSIRGAAPLGADPGSRMPRVAPGGASAGAAFALGLLAAAAAPAWAADTTARVSVGPGGAQGNKDSLGRAMSADGRYVAFTSSASNLVARDTNGETDVFVRDLRAGTTTRVSVGFRGARPNEGSINPAISADGRYVAFVSSASNLVADDRNDRADVFARDLRAGTTSLVSVGAGGVQGNGFTEGQPTVSADGRLVAFTSEATNLVAGDTNGFEDAFVRDRQAGTTRRVSVGSGGTQADDEAFNPAISGDGRLVAFNSSAGNLIAGDTKTRRTCSSAT